MPRYSPQIPLSNLLHSYAGVVIALALCFFAPRAQSASFTYSRTASNTIGTADQWSAGTNWSAIPVSGTATTLNFNGALLAGTTIFTNNDIAGDFKLNLLNFAASGPASGGAPAYAISGNRLEFISNGVTAPVLNIAATGAVSPVLTISNDLLLTGNLSITQSSTATLSGVISGGGGLTKTLGGALTLSNANTYSGGTTLSAGTISVGNNSALGSGAVALNGGVLTNVNGTMITLSNNLIVANGATTNVRTTGTSPTSSLTVNGAVTGNGILQSSGIAGGSGVMAFQGDFSQFTGTLNPFSNTIVMTNLGGSTAASMNLGQATLDIGGIAGNNRRPTIQAGILQAGAFQGTGALAAAAGGSLQVGALNTNTTYSGVTASSNLALIKVGSGTLTFNSASNWATFGGGGLSVNGGAVVEDLGNTGTGGTAPAGVGFLLGALKVGGGTFTLLGKSGTNNSQTFTAFTVNAGASAVTAGLNGGNGTLLQLTAITRGVGGTVDFTNPGGALSATNGITTTTANNAAGILGGYATVGGTDWAVSGGSATAPITAFAAYTGMVATGGSTTTNYSVAGAGTTLSGAVTINSLKVTDTGASQSLSLSGNNLTFTGSQGGLLYAGGVANAYTIYGGNGTDGTGVIGGGAAAGNEFIVNVKSGATLTITAPIINTGAASTGFLTTTGGGTLILNSVNGSTFSGTSYLNGGIVEIAQDTNLGTGAVAMNGSTLRLGSGGTYGGGTLFSNNRSIVLGNNGGTIDTNGSSVTYGGIIAGGVVNTINANTAGGFSLTKAGSGTLALTNANTYGGATIITGGVLSASSLNVTQGENGGVASSIGAAPNTAPYLVLNGGTLQYTGGAATTDRHFTLGANGGGIDASGVAGTALNWAGNTGSGGTAVNAVAFAGSGARTFTLSGNNTSANTFAMILGNGAGGATGLTKSGTGKWVLTARNTYTGATAVNAGTLLINGDQSAATGNVSVASGAILGGSGTVGGATTVNGIIAPGNSIGTLTVANDVTWNGGLTPDGATDWKFELGAISGSSDLLSLSGDDFLKGTGTAFRFDFQGTGVQGTFTLVDYSTTTFSISDFSYTGLGGGLSGTFVFNGSQLDFVIVPEPSTVLLSALGLIVVLSRIRRQRKVVSSR